jgi:hypothetical protein
MLKIAEEYMVLQPAYRVEKTISTSKTLTLTELPFAIGDRVEILIMRQTPQPREKHYSLRGQPLHYEYPFDSVAENDWEILA